MLKIIKVIFFSKKNLTQEHTLIIMNNQVSDNGTVEPLV